MCKAEVVVRVRGAWEARSRLVRGFYHPAGCMGARHPHLDLRADDLEGTLLLDLASRGGARVAVRELGGCLELEYPGLEPVIVCLDGLEAGEGWGYVTVHRRGWVYLSLPGLRTAAPKRGREQGGGGRG